MQDYRVGYVDASGEAVAIFIDSAGDCNPGYLMSYAKHGEHSEASLGWVREQPLAGEALYRELHAYLSQRYGNQGSEPVNLVIDQAAVPR